MKHKSLWYFFIFILMVHCGGGQRTNASFSVESNGEDNYSGSSLEGGAITELPINSNNQAQMSFGAIEDNEQYIVAVYSYDQQGASNTYHIGSSENFDLSAPLPNLSFLTSENEGDLSEDFHSHLRNLENELDDSFLLENKTPSASKAVTTKYLKVGTTRSFKVLNSFTGSNSYETVTAEAVYETDNFIAYVDVRNLDNFNDGELEEILGNFDDIIDTERDLFGHESDVDGDGKSNILFTQVVNQVGGSAGGIVTGFFYAVDLFDASFYPQSNETEIIYTFVPDPKGEYGVSISNEFAKSNIHPSVLPHEFQHMINFNQHYFVHGGAPETSAMNESLSHLAEDVYSIDQNKYMRQTGPENPSRIAGYMASVEDLCITCGSSLYQRGGSYLMVRYAYEQAELGNLPGATSGADFLYRMTRTSKIGVDNFVHAAYGNGDTDTQFREFMGQFGLALFFSDTGLSEDNRLELNGLNLRDVQNDNRGTVLQGPSISTLDSFLLTGKIAAASVSFIELDGAQINEMGGELTLQLPNNNTAGAYLIQTGL